MVALLFLIIILPIALLITAVTCVGVCLVDAVYDTGKSLYNKQCPVNKYRQ